MKIEVRSLRKYKDVNSKTIASLNLLLNDAIIIRDVKLLKTEKGLQVFMPARKTTGGNTLVIANPTNKKISEEIMKCVLDAYDDGVISKGIAEELEITELKMKIINNPNTPRLKAIVMITFNDAITINDIRIIETENGLFVVMPTARNLENDYYYDLVIPTTKKYYEEITNRILEGYKKIAPEENGQSSNSQIKVQVLGIKRTTNEESKILASADICINDSIIVHDIKIIKTEKGPVAIMPTKKDFSGKINDIVVLRKKEVNDEIQRAIIICYNGGPDMHGKNKEMHISEIKILKSKDIESGYMKNLATVDVVFDNAIEITNLKFMEVEENNGKKKNIIAMPSRRISAEEYKDIIVITSQDLIKKITNKVIETYEE